MGRFCCNVIIGERAIAELWFVTTVLAVIAFVEIISLYIYISFSTQLHQQQSRTRHQYEPSGSLTSSLSSPENPLVVAPYTPQQTPGRARTGTRSPQTNRHVQPQETRAALHNQLQKINQSLKTSSTIPMTLQVTVLPTQPAAGKIKTL